jgi:hypothetical protein
MHQSRENNGYINLSLNVGNNNPFSKKKEILEKKKRK